MKASGWTPERRQRQAEAIHTWRPWQQSTGPKTNEGKRRVASNAYQGGVRPMLRGLGATLRSQSQWLADELGGR